MTFEIAETALSGEALHAALLHVPNRQADGRVAGLFVLIRDITERRRTAEALHQAYQNLEQRVRERTAELTTLNDQFKREIHERSQVEARACARPSARRNRPTCRRPSSSRRSATTCCNR